jgi:hypothetical protein
MRNRLVAAVVMVARVAPVLVVTATRMESLRVLDPSGASATTQIDVRSNTLLATLREGTANTWQDGTAGAPGR